MPSPSFVPALTIGIVLGLLALPSSRGEEQTSQNNERLAKGLKQYPEADTNKDGILTMTEGLAYLAKVKAKSEKAPSAAELAKNPPTFADVPYGPFERNKLDFWKAKSDRPAPVIVFIHGGGFTSGDKSKVRGDRTLTDALAANVNFAAINYLRAVNAAMPEPNPNYVPGGLRSGDSKGRGKGGGKGPPRQ